MQSRLLIASSTNHCGLSEVLVGSQGLRIEGFRDLGFRV